MSISESIARARADLQRHLAERADYDSAEVPGTLRFYLRMVASAVTRASGAPTMFAALDHLDTALAELAEAANHLPPSRR